MDQVRAWKRYILVLMSSSMLFQLTAIALLLTSLRFRGAIDANVIQLPRKGSIRRETTSYCVDCIHLTLQITI